MLPFATVERIKISTNTSIHITKHLNCWRHQAVSVRWRRTMSHFQAFAMNFLSKMCSSVVVLCSFFRINFSFWIWWNNSSSLKSLTFVKNTISFECGVFFVFFIRFASFWERHLLLTNEKEFSFSEKCTFILKHSPLRNFVSLQLLFYRSGNCSAWSVCSINNKYFIYIACFTERSQIFLGFSQW